MLIHAMMFSLNTALYFEYIESAANWADDISRHGTQAEWHWRKGFATAAIVVPTPLFKLNLRCALGVMAYL